MTNKDIIKQYVDTGLGIPRYQFDKLPPNLKQTYLRKMEIVIKQNIGYMDYYYGELPIETQFFLINQDPSDIRHIKNPNKDVQMAAFKKDDGVVRYIENLDIEIQKMLVLQNPDNIMVIKNPNKYIQIYAVTEDPHSIAYIHNPDKEIQMLAVKKDIDCYEYIENPDPEVEEYVSDYMEKNYKDIDQ
jgi:hypothetical protein